MLLISFVAIESKQRYSCQTDKLFLVIFLKISPCFLPVSLAGVGIPGGGGIRTTLLSIFVRRGCAVFQGIVFAYFFPRTGYQ